MPPVLAGEIARFRDAVGLPVEDKTLSLSYHYREAADEERAKAELEAVAAQARAAGLDARWGRKVLEIRPPVPADKGTAVGSLLERSGARLGLYAGDDTTDLDAFVGLVSAELEHAVRVAVASEEGPSELSDAADLVVDGPAEMAATPTPAVGAPRLGGRRPPSSGGADGQAQDVPAVQGRVREVGLAGRVDTLEDGLVLVVGALSPEADEREGHRRHDLPARRLLHPRCERARQALVLADHRLQPLAAVAADHRPELERTESGGRAPGRSRSGSSTPSSLVRRYSGAMLNASRRTSGCAGVEERAVDRREEPLVRVDDDRVGLRSTPASAQRFSAQTTAEPGVGRVDMQPGARLGAERCDLGDRVDGGRRGRPDRRDDGGGLASRSASASASGRIRNSSSDGHLAQRNAEQPRSLVHGRVRVLGADDGVPSGRRCRAAVSAARVEVDAVSSMCPCRPSGSPRSCRSQSSASSSSSVAAGDVRQSIAVDVQGGGEKLGEDPRLRPGDGEVGEEARMVPVRDPGQKHLVEVAQDGGERLPRSRAATPAARRGPGRAPPARAPGSSRTPSR